MDEQSEYIEAYFEKQLSGAERKQFEERCVQDRVFAKEVAFYISSREAIRQELLEQKKVLWASGAVNSRKMTIRIWLPYAAAACVILFFALYFLYSSSAPERMASKYIQENLSQLSQSMDASPDSLQQGIAAYNNKDFNTALQLFENLYKSHPENNNALKYAGLVYLSIKNYDKAIRMFDELAGKKGLYSNPGLFYKAIALLQRNKGTDEDQAKQLLEKVVSQQSDGSTEAVKWLKEW